jgi:hypothetical protein
MPGTPSKSLHQPHHNIGVEQVRGHRQSSSRSRESREITGAAGNDATMRSNSATASCGEVAVGRGRKTTSASPAGLQLNGKAHEGSCKLVDSLWGISHTGECGANDFRWRL